MARVTVASTRDYDQYAAAHTTAVMSDGQWWKVVKTTNSNFEFWYSNDEGSTWAEDTGSNISESLEPGALCVDADDNLWFVRQGSSTVLVIHTGTVSGNAITWNATTQSVTVPTTTTHTTDICAFPEGSGTRVGVIARTSSTDDSVETYYWNGTAFSDNQTITYDTTGTIYYRCTLSFSHTGDGLTPTSTPHFHVTSWAGQNIDYWKLTWSSGPSWSATGGKRDITSNIDTTYANQGVNGYVFDGTRSIFAGVNSSGDLKVYERDEADTTTSDISPSVDPTSGPNNQACQWSLGYDNSQNLYFAINYNSSQYPAYVKYDRGADSWDSAYTTIDSTSTVPAGDRITWVNNAGYLGTHLSAIWEDTATVYSSYVTSLNSPPDQPTWNNTDNDVADVAETLTLDWNFVDDDSGDTQSKYKLERRKNDNLLWAPTDANFETSIGNWLSAQGCAISRSSAQAKEGTWSMLIDVTGGVDWYAAAANNMTFSGAGVPTISAADVFTYGIPWDSAIQGNLGFGYYGVGHTNTIYLYEYWFDEDGAYVARWSRSRSCLNGSWSAGASVIANAATRKYVIPVFYGTGYAAGEDVHVDELYLTLASSGGYEVPNPDWYTGAAWSTEQWVTTSTEEVTLAASWGADGDGTHIYSVWTNDGTADSVSKSVPLRVIPSAQDNPTLDAIGTITAKTKTVGWTVTTQTKHHLRIYRDVGLTDLEYDNGIVVTGTKSDTIPFNEEGSRWIWLTTWNDEGLASDVDTEAVTVDWADPPRPVVKPDSTVIELATSGNSTASLRGTGGTNEEQGQSFEATTTSTVTAIGVRSDIGLGTPTDTVTCTIYSDSNFTTALGVSDTRNAVDFDESTFLYHVFNFPVPVSVVSGTTYYVAFSRSDTYDASNYVGIRQNTANPYANGSAYTKNNGTWSITSGTDLWMMVFQSDPTPTTAGAMTVVVANPTPGAGEGGTAATSYNEIWRREWDDDTTAIRIDDDLAEDGTFTDWGPASGVQYQYKAVAWNTTNTTSNESDWTA